MQHTLGLSSAWGREGAPQDTPGVYVPHKHVLQGCYSCLCMRYVGPISSSFDCTCCRLHCLGQLCCSNCLQYTPAVVICC